jgi:large subunit ribosomal protein L4
MAGEVTAPNLTGQGSVDLDPTVFSEPFHNSLVFEAVRAEQAARRRGTASTKTRAEVAMTGTKAWSQKGTGRARVGALSSPQRVGGGVAFGPKPRHYVVKVNRKARRRALRAALSVHARRESLAILDPARFEAPSTKAAAEALGDRVRERTLVVLSLHEGEGSSEVACGKSFRNLPAVTVLPVEAVGVADVVGARRLLLSPAALERLARRAATPPGRTADAAEAEPEAEETG